MTDKHMPVGARVRRCQDGTWRYGRISQADYCSTTRTYVFLVRTESELELWPLRDTHLD